jgi:hypothetical protein
MMNTNKLQDKDDRAAGPPPAGAAPGKVWRYSRCDGWRHVDDPLLAAGCGPDADPSDAGFELFVEHGTDTSTLCLSVYARVGDDVYLIVLGGVLLNRTFVAADLPSLLAVLPPLVAMTRDAAALDEVERQHAERVKRKRRGLVYNARARRMEEAG